jgi:uncharacterized protein (DUF1778 family)
MLVAMGLGRKSALLPTHRRAAGFRFRACLSAQWLALVSPPGWAAWMPGHNTLAQVHDVYHRGRSSQGRHVAMQTIDRAVTPSNSGSRAVNLRVREDIRDLIDRAAQSQGKSRSEFMIDAARRATEEALLDQTLVRVDQASYALFLDVLDQPPGGEGFDRLMKVAKPWKA